MLVARRHPPLDLLAQTLVDAGASAHVIAADQQAMAGGADRNWGPTVNPAQLADLLWNMHRAKSPAETTYPERRASR